MNLIIRTTCLTLSLISVNALSHTQISYPDGYRNWTHVKTLTLHSGHPLETPFKGIHHIYANKAGVSGIKSGQYNDGATIVFDLLESNTADNASAEGKRILIGVMTRNAIKYKQTGGWGFEAWSGNSKTERLTSDGGSSCFACHTSQKDANYVFSRWRE